MEIKEWIETLEGVIKEEKDEEKKRKAYEVFERVKKVFKSAEEAERKVEKNEMGFVAAMFVIETHSKAIQEMLKEITEILYR